MPCHISRLLVRQVLHIFVLIFVSTSSILGISYISNMEKGKILRFQCETVMVRFGPGGTGILGGR